MKTANTTSNKMCRYQVIKLLFYRYMYWTDWSNVPKIERAAMDGTDRLVLIDDGGRANGLTIDYTERRIYWADLDNRHIQSANLVGE